MARVRRKFLGGGGRMGFKNKGVLRILDKYKERGWHTTS
jgi:hypothetical protein